MRRLPAVAGLIAALAAVGCGSDPVVPPSTGVPETAPSHESPEASSVSPTHPPIGRRPDDCQPGPDPVPVSDHVGNGIGGDPAWAIGFGADGFLGFNPDDPYGGHGWLRKVLWLVRRTTRDPITVSGHRIDDDGALWFAYPGPDAQVTSLVLDPSTPDGEHGDWFEYRGYFVLPTAGCYRLEAVWPSGGWEVTFSAGLDPTQG